MHTPINIQWPVACLRSNTMVRLSHAEHASIALGALLYLDALYRHQARLEFRMTDRAG